MDLVLGEGDDEGEDEKPTSEDVEMRSGKRRRGSSKKKPPHLRVVEPEALFGSVRQDEFGADTTATRHGRSDGFWYGGCYEDFDS